jgi:hypothetical protein
MENSKTSTYPSPLAAPWGDRAGPGAEVGDKDRVVKDVNHSVAVEVAVARRRDEVKATQLGDAPRLAPAGLRELSSRIERRAVAIVEPGERRDDVVHPTPDGRPRRAVPPCDVERILSRLREVPGDVGDGGPLGVICCARVLILIP